MIPDEALAGILRAGDISPHALLADFERYTAETTLGGFVSIVTPEYVPALHHRKLIEKLEAVERGEIPRLIVCMPPGSAKALALDTPIPTPSGWSTMGQLRVGDRVFDDRGQPCTVIRKTEVFHDRPVYEVRTDCGDTIISDEDHEWLVCLCRKPRRPLAPLNGDGRGRKFLLSRDDPISRFKIKQTRELARRRAKRPMVRCAEALELPAVNLPVDPYLLGAWLGDGTSSSGEITSGDADRPWLRAEIESLGYETRDRKATGRFGVTGLRGPLVELSVLSDPWHKVYGSKHIPALYMRASIEQRRALLQGLIDTDGTVQPNGHTAFCSTNARLASGVAELVRSLGAKASIGESRAVLKGKDCGPYWRVYFYLQDAARMPRKAAKTRNGSRTPNTYLTVASAGIADTVCIEVDSPSHLFLCGVSMTPTHNSTFASIIFPAWYLGRNPRKSLIGASHSGELAERFGRRVRNLVGSEGFQRAFGFGISNNNAAADRWETQPGGEYYAVGVNASVTGRRCDLGLIDDPVKGRQEADSPTIRQRTWDWYKSDFWTRLKPNGAIVVIATRWHESDLVGQLLAEQEVGGEQWELLSIPAEAEGDDPLGRKPGELLWPEWFTSEMFAEAKRDPRNWSALYQQRPVPDSGEYFKAEWIRWFDIGPARSTLRIYGASDYAVTDEGGDYTVHGVVGVDPDDNIYVLDWWREQTASDAWVEAFIDLAEKWKPLMWAEESGQIIKSVGPFLERRLRERRVYPYRRAFTSSRDKQTRAQSIRGRMAMGKVYFPKREAWSSDLVSELLRFDAGRNDDQVDVLSLVGRMLDVMVPGTAPKRELPMRTIRHMTMDELWKHGVKPERDRVRL